MTIVWCVDSAHVGYSVWNFYYLEFVVNMAKHVFWPWMSGRIETATIWKNLVHQVSKCACELLGWTVHPFRATYHLRNLSDHTMPGKPVSWEQGKVLEHNISGNI